MDDYIVEKLEFIKEEKERNFQIIKNGTGWVMIESEDSIFDLAYKAGNTRVIALKKQVDGSFNYTIAKKSELVNNFNVGPGSKEGSILYELNKIEHGWGGSSTIGGAPRNSDGSRSKISPEEVFTIVENIVNNKK